jgi:hypothetical protein
MKRSASVLLALALILALSATAWASGDFSDTAGLNSSQQAALKELSDRGVINGYPDGTFKPANNVTRAEFSKMLGVYTGQREIKSPISPFNDVFAADWFYGWVCRAKEDGLVNGYLDGTYKPQNSITQQEIATVLVRYSGVNTKDFGWPDDYIKAAQAAGAFDNIVFVGAAPASRIITCQMLYNMLPKQDAGEEPPPSATVRGIVTELAAGSVTIKDGKGASKTYTVSANLLPDKLILGSYLELAVSGQAVVKVAESILPKKGVFVWDVALDGSSAVIDDKKYDLKEADIFAVEYTLNKAYSSETFIKGGPMDREILSLGGRLAAEMAVVVEADGGKLIAAYLVNASIIVTGGRLDVVDGGYSSSKGKGVYFLGRDAGLPIKSGLSIPDEGVFIHYTLRDGEINTWQLLLDISNEKIYHAEDALKNARASDPSSWVGATGGRVSIPGGPGSFDNMDNYKAEVMSIGSGRQSVLLGTNNVNYWLAEGCLVYEVSPSGKIKQGSRSSIEKGQDVIALVSLDGEICYLFCFVD